MGKDLSEKKQLVLKSFQNAFDYEMALEVYNVSDEERELMEADELFWLGIQMAECAMKEQLILDLRHLASDKNRKESVRLEAIKTLGKIVYPEAFRKTDDVGNNESNVHIYLPDNGRGKGSANAGGKKQVKGTLVTKDESKKTR